MNTTLTVAWLALAISTLSLIVSGLNALRDRAKLRIKSRYFEGWEGMSAEITIDMVNAGRRPTILSTLQSESTRRSRFGRSSISNWSGRYLAHPSGLTLTEHQSYRHTLDVDDLLFEVADITYIADDMCVMDTLGNRHEIKNIRENIRKLLEWHERQKNRERDSKKALD